jgi:hypothetical protein
MPDKFVDLYEIIVHLNTDKVGARMEKYRVKQTGTNFLPQMLQPEHEKQGYSYRMNGRVKVSDLMKIQQIGFGFGCDHVYRHIYCFEHQRADALMMLRAEIDSTVTRMRDQVAKLYDTWTNRPFAVEEKKRKAVKPARVKRYNDIDPSWPA